MATVAAIGAVVAAAGVVVGVIGASKARKAQKRLDEARAARERQQQVRQSRIAAGQVQQAGINAGAAGSSAVLSGVENVAQQARGNIAFISQINALQNRLANARALSNLGAGIKAFGGGIISLSSSFGPSNAGAGKSQAGVVPQVSRTITVGPAPVFNLG